MWHRQTGSGVRAVLHHQTDRQVHCTRSQCFSWNRARTFRRDYLLQSAGRRGGFYGDLASARYYRGARCLSGAGIRRGGLTMYWKKPRPLTLVVLSLLGAHVVATATLPTGSYPLTVIGNVFPLFCGVVLIVQCWRNSRCAEGPVRIFWLLMGASFGFQIASQFYFGYFEVLIREAVSGPCCDCLFFLLAVPLLAALSIC